VVGWHTFSSVLTTVYLENEHPLWVWVNLYAVITSEHVFRKHSHEYKLFSLMNIYLYIISIYRDSCVYIDSYVLICLFRQETNQFFERILQNFYIYMIRFHKSRKAFINIYQPGTYRLYVAQTSFFQSVRTVRLQCRRNPWTKDTGVEQHLQKPLVPWRIEAPQHFSYMAPYLISATALNMLQAPWMHKLLRVYQSNKRMKLLIFMKDVEIESST